MKDAKKQQSFDSVAARQRISQLALTESAEPGWRTVSSIRQPFVYKAMMLMTTAGIITGLLQYFYRTGMVSREIKDFYGAAIYIFILGGGIFLSGGLTIKRAAILLLNIAVVQGWEYFFWDKPKLYVFYFPLAIWMFVWISYKEPTIMARFGLRKEKWLPDIISALALAGIFVLYSIITFANFGQKFNFDLWKIASHTAVMLPQNLAAFGFIFLLWDYLHGQGLSHIGSLTVLFISINMYFIPMFIALSLAGVIPPGLAAATVLAYSLAFVLLMSLAFNNMKNVLTAVFMMTSLNELLVITGWI